MQSQAETIFRKMRLVLFQPDIPQNTGAILRLAACFGLGVDIVFPCGFAWDAARLRRAGMDYLDLVRIERHRHWEAYLECRRERGPEAGRLIVLSTRAARSYADFAFAPDDNLILGRESAGLPEEIHALADHRLRIPLRPEARSLNQAMAAAIVAAEAQRQMGYFQP